MATIPPSFPPIIPLADDVPETFNDREHRHFYLRDKTLISPSFFPFLDLTRYLPEDPELRGLFIHIKLPEAPRLDRYPYLETLTLYCTNLPEREIIDLTQCAQLRECSIVAQRCIQPPDFTRCTLLKELLLQGNPWMELPPNLTRCTALRKFSGDRNGFTTPPIVTHCPQLESLNLNANKLTQCPDVTGCTKLRFVDLGDNKLTALHDSILSLPKNCDVFAGGNPWTPEYVENFQGRLEQHRANHPDQGPRVFFKHFIGR